MNGCSSGLGLHQIDIWLTKLTKKDEEIQWYRVQLDSCFDFTIRSDFYHCIVFILFLVFFFICFSFDSNWLFIFKPAICFDHLIWFDFFRFFFFGKRIIWKILMRNWVCISVTSFYKDVFKTFPYSVNPYGALGDYLGLSRFFWLWTCL